MLQLLKPYIRYYISYAILRHDTTCHGWPPPRRCLMRRRRAVAMLITRAQR
jgi:hypothetical protein